MIGHVAGSPVILAPSWLVIAAFLTYLFVPTVRTAAPGLGTVGTIAAAAGFPVLLAVSVLLHEVGHGLTARRLGIPVTEYVVTLWGGHTQFDRDLPTPGASAAVSLAGPLTNGAISLVTWWASGLVTGLPAVLLAAAALTNGFVAVFNVLPGLPLDGGRLLESLVWAASGDRVRGTVAAGTAGRVIAVGVPLVALGLPLVRGGRPDVVTAIAVALVGAFLWTGASSALRTATLTRQADAVDLLALARPAVVLPAGAAVAALDAVPPGLAVVLVGVDGTPAALVEAGAASSVPPRLRSTTPAHAVAVPLAPSSVVVDRRGLPALRAMSVAQHAGPVAVLVDPASEPPTVLGVVPVAAVASAVERGRRT